LAPRARSDRNQREECRNDRKRKGRHRRLQATAPGASVSPGAKWEPERATQGGAQFKTEFREELSELVTVRDGDREIEVSKQRALIKSLVAAAIDGNQRAAASVLAMCVRMLADAEDDEAIESVEDRDIVETLH
jgi:hypothetical protein